MCGAESKACTDLSKRSDSAENCTATSSGLSSMKADLKKLNNPELEAQSIKAFCESTAARMEAPAE